MNQPIDPLEVSVKRFKATLLEVAAYIREVMGRGPGGQDEDLLERLEDLVRMETDQPSLDDLGFRGEPLISDKLMLQYIAFYRQAMTLWRDILKRRDPSPRAANYLKRLDEAGVFLDELDRRIREQSRRGGSLA